MEQESRRAQWLVLWLDCDREGENIAFEVVEVCTAVNHHLNIKRAHFSALIERFHILNLVSILLCGFQRFITDYFYIVNGNLEFRDIHDAVQNLVQPNKWFADAVDARQVIALRAELPFCCNCLLLLLRLLLYLQEIDLRIGASFTRFQTLLLKDAFNIDSVTDDRNIVLSYGPCQVSCRCMIYSSSSSPISLSLKLVLHRC